MTSKRKEDRVKSGVPGSPYGRKSKEGTSNGISTDGKHVRVIVWPEWSENDVNNEKWEMASKSKEKDKSKSPQMIQNLFDDPDGRLCLPHSIKVSKWRRASDYFTKIPVVVDSENGMHDFDIFTPNEHLFISETMRWIICQINTLWITSTKKGSNEIPETHDIMGINSAGSHHSWKFWEHIYSLNKVGKGLPQYNPAGKYIVKLFWMGEWRKILVDDSLPFDENDRLLLPVTASNNEMWPIILSKGLLKIASLSYGLPNNDTEFGDFSVIHALTGWIPQVKVITKEHRDQIWKFLKDIIPHWTFSEREKSVLAFNKVENVLSPDNQDNIHEKSDSKETNSKDKRDKKENKDAKTKEKKDKDKEKSKPILLEGKQLYENPETIVCASYKSNFPRLNIIATSKMADQSEALRKIGLVQTYSHPVLLNYYRDCPLIKPKTPDLVPVWKLIRPMIKSEIPQVNDCRLHDFSADKEENSHEMIEIETPFLNYKISNNTFPAMYVKGSKSSITDIFEDVNEKESVSQNNEVNCSNYNKDETEKTIENKIMKENSNAIKNSGTEAKIDVLTESDENNKKRNIDDEVEEGPLKSWIDIDTFCECFQVLYIYHKPETYRYSETIMDNKSNAEQQEPVFLFVDNLESSEVIFCLSAFCKWLPQVENHAVVDNQINLNSPSISTIKDMTINEVNYVENDGDLYNQGSINMCSFLSEHYNWKSLKVGNIFKRARTNGTKAISLKFPPGRNCIRLFIECKNGFNCKVISQNPFFLKNEDGIMPLFTEYPERIKDFATNMMLSFNKVIENFSNIEERKIFEKAFVDLLLSSKEDFEFTSKITQIFGQSFLNVITQLNKDIISQDLVFAVRALTLFFESSVSISSLQQKPSSSYNRSSAKAIPVKVDSRKQSSTKSTTNPDSKEERKLETYNKEYLEEDIILIQKYAKGFHVRNVLNSRDPQSNNHSRVTTELKKIYNIINQNGLKYGMLILNDMSEKYPNIFKYYSFENDILHHISLQEFSGTCTSQSGSGFELLFREIFYLSKEKQKMNLIIKLTCSSPKCTLMVINNDNGELFSDNILKRLHLPNLQANLNGYTLLSFVKDVETVNNWKLKIICDGNDILPHSLIIKPELCTEFSVIKIRDYYIPNNAGSLFNQLVKVKNDHPATIYLKLSCPSAQFRLSIYNFDEEVYYVDGIGEALIPSFVFLKDDVSDIVSARSPSRTSNRSKKNKERHSAKNSRPNSLSSEDNKINKYSIQVFINDDTWPLSELNEEFVKNIQRARKKEIVENKILTENPTKAFQNFDLSKKEGAQKLQGKGKGKERGQDNVKTSKSTEKIGSKAPISDVTTSRPSSNTIDSDKAHWILYFINDSILEENVQIFRNNKKYEQLFSAKKLWEELDPLRFEKGKQVQKSFLEDNAITEDELKNDVYRQEKLKPFDMTTFYCKDYLNEMDHDDSESKRIKRIETFRQHQIDWNYWCQMERSERNKKITSTLTDYKAFQETVNAHRSNYYRARESVKRSSSTKNTN